METHVVHAEAGSGGTSLGNHGWRLTFHTIFSISGVKRVFQSTFCVEIGLCNIQPMHQSLGFCCCVAAHTSKPRILLLCCVAAHKSKPRILLLLCCVAAHTSKPRILLLCCVAAHTSKPWILLLCCVAAPPPPPLFFNVTIWFQKGRRLPYNLTIVIAVVRRCGTNCSLKPKLKTSLLFYP